MRLLTRAIAVVAVTGTTAGASPPNADDPSVVKDAPVVKDPPAAAAGTDPATDPTVAAVEQPKPEPSDANRARLPSTIPVLGRDHTAADVSGAPLPGDESGRTDVIDRGDSTLRILARGALFIPKIAVEVALSPLRGTVWVDDRYDLEGLYYRAFFNSERTIGLIPTATYETGFGGAVGARFEDLDVFGERESVAFQATTGLIYGEPYREGVLISMRTGRRFDRLELGLDANFDRRPSDPFYGIGNGDLTSPTGTPINAQLDPTAVETYHRYQEERIALLADLRIAGYLHVLGTGALTDLAFAPSTSGPPIDDVYDPMTLVGFNSGVRHAYGELELRWDSRRRPTIWEPRDVHSTGFLAAAFVGRVDGIDGSADYTRYGLELQRYWRIANGPRVLITRLRTEGVTGSLDQVAFDELPMLGGGEFLRGYSFERFRDRVAAFGSVQYQWDLSRLVDAYIFSDFGRVYSSLDELTASGMRVGYGIGLELHSDHSFVLEGNIASSIDGGLFFNFSFNPVLDARPRWR